MGEKEWKFFFIEIFSATNDKVEGIEAITCKETQ